jgi:hypothetical protein
MKQTSPPAKSQNIPLESEPEALQKPKPKSVPKPAVYQGSRYSSLILLVLTALVSYALYLISPH